jgi:hypothetical protein
MADMRRPRPQFRHSTLLWITLAVACWFGGMRFERWGVDQILPPWVTEPGHGSFAVKKQVYLKLKALGEKERR